MANVRTVCLAGHSGSGKTELIRALMGQLGTQVELGALPEEKSRGITLDLGVATHRKGDDVFSLIDTPGYVEFLEEIYKGARVSETGLLVVNGEKGVEIGTEIAWKVFQQYEKPVVAFVNRMDAENASFSSAMEGLRELGNFVPVEVSIRDEGGAFVGYMNLLTMKPVFFSGGTGKIPESVQGEAESLREQLLEGLSMVDDTLMEKFLAEEDVSSAEIEAALHQGLLEQVLVPVLCGSAAAKQGLKSLLHMLQHNTPTFDEEASVEDAFHGLVFNVAEDPYLGTMTYVKLLGPLKEGQPFLNLNGDKKESAKEILSPLGTKAEKIPQAGPGEVIVLPKLSEVTLGDTLATAGGADRLELGNLPKPVYTRVITPATQADEEKMSTAFREITKNKATLDFRVDEVTHEMLLSGMGEVQLDAAAERVKNRFRVNIHMDRPHVPYKETIQKMNEAQYRHKKQSGGRGQFGEVHLRVEPLDAGYEFVDAIKGAVIPNQFMPAVEKGVQEAMIEGVLAGYPMDGVRVTVFYGKHHDVDSSEIAFKIAASTAFKQAVQGASPSLLEPVYKLTVWTPRAYTGDIMSSVSGKRGKIHGMDSEGVVERIEAEVPLAEVMEYAVELKSLTQGRATFQQEFLRYQIVRSPELADELLKKEGKGEPQAS